MEKKKKKKKQGGLFRVALIGLPEEGRPFLYCFIPPGMLAYLMYGTDYGAR